MINYSGEDLEFLGNNDGLQELVESYIPFFEKYFCFTEEEIDGAVRHLISLHDTDLILGLLDLYESFVDKENEVFDKDEREHIAKKAVDLSIEIYSGEKSKSATAMAETLKLAAKTGIDPLKLVNKTTLRSASFESYNKCLHALHEHVYSDKRLGDKFTIIGNDENLNENINGFLEQCTSLVCKLNAENVQNVLNSLSDIFYDESSNKYLITPKEAVSQVKTLLISSPERIENNMLSILDALASPSVPDSKIRMAVAGTPSCLLSSSENLKLFMMNFKTSIASLAGRARKLNVGKITAKDLMSMFGSTITITDEDIDKNSENFMAFIDDAAKVFCVENLSNIGCLKREKIAAMPEFKEVFCGPFGEKNAITCMQDFNFLQSDPALLDYIFSIVEESERKGHKNLREYVLRHSGKSVKLAKAIRAKASSGEGVEEDNNFVEELTTKTKRKKRIFELPKLSGEATSDAKKDRLNRSQVITAEKLLGQIIEASKNSKDLDIELVNKLAEAEESIFPVLDMANRARIAIGHAKQRNPKLLSSVIDFYYDYLGATKVLAKVSSKYELSKKYYDDGSPLSQDNPNLDDDLSTEPPYESVETCLKVIEERCGHLDAQGTDILKAHSKFNAISEKLKKNSLIDSDDYEKEIVRQTTNNPTLFRFETRVYAFMERLVKELEKLYPEKSMEILGEENYENYMNGPFVSEFLIRFLLLTSLRNSNYMYQVRKANDFYEIAVPPELKKIAPEKYHRLLKQRQFEEVYLALEKIVSDNFSHNDTYSVSENCRVIANFKGQRFILPKYVEDDYDSEADFCLEHKIHEDPQVIPLSAFGIKKLLGKWEMSKDSTEEIGEIDYAKIIEEINAEDNAKENGDDK